MIRDDIDVDLEADYVPNAIGKERSKGEACADSTNKGCGKGIFFCGLPPSACLWPQINYINKIHNVWHCCQCHPLRSGSGVFCVPPARFNVGVCVGYNFTSTMKWVSSLVSPSPSYRLALFIVTADWRIYSGGLVLANYHWFRTIACLIIQM
jgi:hypothetical protein